MFANFKTKFVPAILVLALVPILAVACGGDSPPVAEPPAPLPTVNVSVSQSRITEGDFVELQVKLSIAPTEALTINFSDDIATATATIADYRARLSLIIPAGSTSGTLDVFSIDDEAVEENETIIIEVAQSPNYQIGNNSRVNITIEDNDEPEPPVTQPMSESLNAASIYELVSPAIAFIETPYASGSGFLIDGNYILTAWHVISLSLGDNRVTFINGEEYNDVPIVATDPYRDLAVLGPINTDIEPLDDFANSNVTVGSTAFLLGYPAENEQNPQPAITQGNISRTREWNGGDLTILQVDITIQGGQSGGVLVNEFGDVLGISNYGIGDTIALVNEINDIMPVISDLKAGRNPNNLGEREYLEVPPIRRNYSNVRLQNFYDEQGFLIPVEAGDTLDIDVNSGDLINVEVYDSTGFLLSTPTDGGISSYSETFDIFVDDVIVVAVDSRTYDSITFNFRSSQEAIIYNRDSDDNRRIDEGDSIFGSIDYPGEIDWFLIDLRVGQSITVCADSFVTDIELLIDTTTGLIENAFQFNFDDGGGFDDLNPLLEYVAPASDEYLILIEAFQGGIGGYEVAIGDRCNDF